MQTNVSKKIRGALERVTFDEHLYTTLGGIILVLILLILALFAFGNLVTSINRAVSGNIEEKREGGGINFKAIDAIALKLNIEIPARNIPSRTSLALNKPPLIFTFSTVRPQVLPKDVAPIFLNVFDPDDDQLQAKWEATAGQILPISPLGPARWIAPEEIGDYEVRVSVTDGVEGRTPVKASISLKVLPRIPAYVAPEELPQYTTKLVGLVKEEESPDIYFVKVEGEKSYKRLLVKTQVVNFYPHLSVDLIRTVPKGTLDTFIFTSWIRGKDKFRVYEINANGTKRWLNMPWETFLGRGGSDEAIFTVNDDEVNFYPSGPDILP